MKAGHFSAKIPGQLSAEINSLLFAIPFTPVFVFYYALPVVA